MQIFVSDGGFGLFLNGMGFKKLIRISYLKYTLVMTDDFLVNKPQLGSRYIDQVSKMG